MKLPHETYETYETGAGERLLLGFEQIVALAALRRLSGSESSEVAHNPNIGLTDVLQRVSDDVEHDVARGMTALVISKFNKLLNKEGALPGDTVNDDIASAISGVVKKIKVEDPNLTFNKQAVTGAARLVRDMEPARAIHYLDETFVYELQDMVPEQSEMYNEIGNYFTVKQLLKRAQNTKNPDVAVRQSVERAWQVAKDPQVYLEGLTDEQVDKEFYSALDSRQLLGLTSTMPQGYNQRLQEAAQRFGGLREQYPLLFAADSSLMVGELLQDAPDSKFAGYDMVARLLIREGIPEEGAVFMAVRHANGRINAAQIDRIVATQKAGYRRLFVSRSRGTGPHEVSRRIQGAVDSGLFEESDAALAAQGLEFRDTMFDIVESDAFSDREKRRAFDSLNDARIDHAAYTYKIEPVVGEHFSDSERRQYGLAIAKALYALKYYADHGVKEQIVPMGSKEVPVAMNKQEMLAALTYLQSHARREAMVEIATHTLDVANDENGANLELGYPLKTESKMLVLTKQRWSPVASEYERGKSPRINRTCGVVGNTPSLVAHERELDSLSLRNDLDSDGVLRLDIGGKTAEPNTPDFLVAKLLSLGGWYRAQIHNDTASDYHVDIDTAMDRDEFARIVTRYRRAIRYAPGLPRVADGHNRVALPDQLAA